MKRAYFIKNFFIQLFVFLFLIDLCEGNTINNQNNNSQSQQDSIEVHWYNTNKKVFVLRTKAQLRGFADLVNAGIDFHDQEIRLANDLIINDTTNWKKWESLARADLEQWIPIGREDRPFSGTFDGQNHKIYGLYINRGMDSYYQGLFGLVLNGKIRNVQVKCSFFGAHDHVGGIAGMIGYQSEIINCSFLGRIKAIGHMIGGICGKAEDYNRIVNCSNTGNISGMNRVGGIVGSFMWGSFYNCSNRGEIAGKRQRIGGIAGALLDATLYDLRTLSQGQEIDRGMIRNIKDRSEKLKDTKDTFANNYNIGAISGEDMIGGITGSFAYVDNLIDSIKTKASTSSYGNITDLRTSVDSINRFFRLSNKKGTYFANCYNTGKITGQYSVYTDGLVGHYGWRWRDAVYLLDRQGDRCYWSDSSIVVYQLETQRLPRDLRSFETSVEKDIYNVRSPKVFQKIANVDMRAELFVTMLNQWVNKHGLPFKQWEVDKGNVNGGYPIFE